MRWGWMALGVMAFGCGVSSARLGDGANAHGYDPWADSGVRSEPDAGSGVPGPAEEGPLGAGHPSDAGLPISETALRVEAAPAAALARAHSLGSELLSTQDVYRTDTVNLILWATRLSGASTDFTTVGTLHLAGDALTYDPAPRDHLELRNGQALELALSCETFRGDLTSPSADEFFLQDHALDCRFTLPDALDLTLTSERDGGNAVRGIEGTVLTDGGALAVTLTETLRTTSSTSRGVPQVRWVRERNGEVRETDSDVRLEVDEDQVGLLIGDASGLITEAWTLRTSVQTPLATWRFAADSIHLRQEAGRADAVDASGTLERGGEVRGILSTDGGEVSLDIGPEHVRLELP